MYGAGPAKSFWRFSLASSFSLRFANNQTLIIWKALPLLIFRAVTALSIINVVLSFRFQNGCTIFVK